MLSRLKKLSAQRRQARFQPGSFLEHRARLLSFGVYGALGVLAARAVVIHLFPPSLEHLQTIAERQYQQHLELSPYRGTIFDRRAEPLAISIRMPSLFVNPRVFDVTPQEAQEISRIIKMPADKIIAISKKRSYFSWVKRKIGKDAAEKVMALKIKGLHQVMEPARYYPAGQAASHLLGYVGIDNRGLMGLERQFERYLRGNIVRINESKDARGKTIFLQSAHAAPEKSGQNIHLTIDRAVQEIAEKELEKGVRNAKAKSGFAVVADPHTGRILALANYPTFDPNSRTTLDVNLTRNHALGDLYEPGSVVKPFLVATALKNKKITPDEIFYCENGAYRDGPIRIHDSHPVKMASTADVLVQSSNICSYKIAKRLEPKGLYEGYRQFGFGEANAIDFPGKSLGRLLSWEDWRPARFANIAFGQGFVTSGLEIVRAYSALANGGNLVDPYIIDHIEGSDGKILVSNTTRLIRQVISPELAKTMRQMLQQVVEKEGSKAQMAEFSAGGKTGTTEKVDPRTRAYSTDLRIASFVGFTPVEDPHLVVYVVIDEPGIKPYYGGIWAAPVFRGIAEETLRYLNVAPDKQNQIAQRP